MLSTQHTTKKKCRNTHMNGHFHSCRRNFLQNHFHPIRTFLGTQNFSSLLIWTIFYLGSTAHFRLLFLVRVDVRSALPFPTAHHPNHEDCCSVSSCLCVPGLQCHPCSSRFALKSSSPRRIYPYTMIQCRWNWMWRVHLPCWCYRVLCSQQPHWTTYPLYSLRRKNKRKRKAKKIKIEEENK